VLTHRQDRIIELWMRGWSVPEIGEELRLPVTRVSDEKYKALRKLERRLSVQHDELTFGLPSRAASAV
jgi:DNA-binding NarL/FixJ family response regulator